jgi:antitoxin (DNA-binding transcriptional repressor) of toxin-antitoxin stability system
VIITKRGKAIVKITAIKSEGQLDPLLGAMKSVGETVGNLTEPMEEDWELD